MSKFGYYKLFAVTPKLFLGNVEKNVTEHLRLIKEIQDQGKKGIIVFPELSLTGYTCEDLFHTQSLLDATKKGLKRLIEETKKIDSIIIVGLPFENHGRLYNTACVIHKGKAVSLHPKTHLPNYKEFYEKRYFICGEGVDEIVDINGVKVPFKTKQILKTGELSFGIEICEDLWAPVNVGTSLALAGAELIINISASNELVGKNNYRKDLIKITSARLNCGYLYVSSGPLESSKDIVFGGHKVYSEDGSILSESDRFSFESNILETEVDVQKINFERTKNTTFGNTKKEEVSTVILEPLSQTLDIKRSISPFPFVPQDVKELEVRVREIIEIQATGLARRLLAIGQNTKIVLGLSGGLDSTLALLVGIRACEKLNLPPTTICTISMPGFGTSERTRNQAKDLAQAFGTTFLEIDITKATTQHLVDINHNLVDFVYENAQARERTQCLFDMANKVGGFVLGTGNLSEYATGWTTFSGDALSNYGVNAGVPKTLVKFLVKNYPATDDQRQILDRIFNTPISPELLPLDAQGNIQQSTEKTIGSYDLIDFYIFYFLRNGFNQNKIQFLEEKAFQGTYTSEEMETVFKRTYKRFRINQFKRTTLPPGPKVGSVSISPRGDWRCPDENSEEENS